MQFVVDFEMESGYNEAHVPVPFIISTNGWGLFVESPYPGAFDVAATEEDRVDAWFGTGVDSKDGLRFWLFAADHPLDLTKKYYDITGYPMLPAKWALGPWIWRDEIDNQTAVEEDLRTIRALNLATSGYWIDRPFASGVNAFDFKPQDYPDPQAMINLAHDLGFRMALWQAPYIWLATRNLQMKQRRFWHMPRSKDFFQILLVCRLTDGAISLILPIPKHLRGGNRLSSATPTWGLKDSSWITQKT